VNELSGEGSPSARLPRVAVVNDYELVFAGVAAMLRPYTDRLEIADPISIDEPVTGPPVDLALYDTFGREGIGHRALERLLRKDKVRRVAVYTADASAASVRIALDLGVSGYLSKATPAAQLVEQIERIVAGEVVVETNGTGATSNRQARAWPGKESGLSERESEIVALVALGRRNAEIATALYISVETVKTHLSHAFRKLRLTNRTQVASFVLRDDSFRHRGES
jgi:DNA-binding NarL/FixJ family response regulator